MISQMISVARENTHLVGIRMIVAYVEWKEKKKTGHEKF